MKSEIWLDLGWWFTHTMVVASLIMGLCWLLCRKSHANRVRFLSGWAIRSVVVAAFLCLLQSSLPSLAWFTLPTPDWAMSKLVAEKSNKAEDDLVEQAKNNQQLFKQLSNYSITAELVKGDDHADENSFSLNVNPYQELVDLPVPSIPGQKHGQPEGLIAPANVNEFYLIEPVNSQNKEQDQQATVLPAKQGAVEQANETRQGVVESPTRKIIVDILRILLVAYAFGVTFCLLQLFFSQIAILRIAATSSKAPARVQDLFAAACEKNNLQAKLLLSNRVSSPVCFGIFQSTVVLPKQFAQTAYDSELNWVFAHELDHISRGDHRLIWWSGLARALFFFLPVYWSIRSQLELAQEFLADAAAAAVGDATEYAQFLVSLSTAPNISKAARHPLTATGVKARRSQLFRRVSMLVDNQNKSDLPSRKWRFMAASGTLSTVILLSGFGFAAPKTAPAAIDPKNPVVLETIGEVVTEEPSPAQKGNAKLDEAKAKAEEAEKKLADAKNALLKAQQEKAKALIEIETAKNKAGKQNQDQDKAEITTLKAQIAEAAKKGDVETVNKLVEKLTEKSANAKVLRANISGLKVLPAVPPVPGIASIPAKPPVPSAPPVPVVPRAPLEPNAPPVPGAPPVAGASKALIFPARPAAYTVKLNNDSVKEAMDRGIAEFKKQLEQATSPEAKAEIEKSLKAFEESMKKAIEMMPKVQQKATENLDNLQQQLFIPRENFNLQLEGIFIPGEGRLGIQIEQISPALSEQLDIKNGIVVAQVVAGSAAEKAGIKKNDIIVEFAAEEVKSDLNTFIEKVNGLKKDEKVKIVVIRKGKKETITELVIPEKKARVLSKVLEDKRVDDGQLNELMKEIETLNAERAKMLQDLLKKKGPKDGEGNKKGPRDAEAGVVEVNQSSSMSVSVENGKVKINAEKNGIKYEIKGTIDNGTESIKITDGESTHEGKTVDELPEKYQKEVKTMLKNTKIISK